MQNTKLAHSLSPLVSISVTSFAPRKLTCQILTLAVFFSPFLVLPLRLRVHRKILIIMHPWVDGKLINGEGGLLKGDYSTIIS